MLDDTNHGHKTRRNLLAGVGAASTLAITGCLGGTGDADGGDNDADGGDGEDDRYGGTLTFSASESVQQLHPHYRIAIIDTQLAVHVVESLFILNDDLLPEPHLVADYSVEDDGQTYIFELPEGAMFHPPVDREMVADDVVASLQNVAEDESAQSHPDMSPVSDIEAIDDYTVEVSLEHPYPALLSTVLASTDTAILPEERMDNDSHPVGTGPFQFEEWEQGNYVRLSKFDDYRQDGLPYFDEVHTNPTSENSVRYDELVSGDSEIVINVPTNNAQQVADNPDLELVEYTGLVNEFLAMNNGREPFDDKRVRQAIDYAIDKEQAIEFALDGYGEPAVTPLAGFHAYALDADPRPQDFDQARQLLTDAGYGDGFSMELLLPEAYTPSVELGTPLQQWLGEIGIDCEIQVTTWDNVLDRTFSEGDYDMTSFPFLGTHATPYGAFNKICHSEGGLNYFNYDDNELDALVEEAARTVDEDTQRDLYIQAQERLREQTPFINPFYWAQLFGRRKIVKGQFVWGPSELRTWNNYFEQ